jgi:steroid delta-isomerase-like uncharacterized protein
MEIGEAQGLCNRWLPLWTGNRPEELIQAYADDVFYRDAANPEGLKGKPAFLAYLRQVLDRFPDWVYQAESISPMEGGFVLRWHATIPVSGTVARETGLDLVFVDQGQITRNEVYFDRAALLEELRRANSDGARHERG